MESTCECGCGREITYADPDPYFKDAQCQRLWLESVNHPDPQAWRARQRYLAALYYSEPGWAERVGCWYGEITDAMFIYEHRYGVWRQRNDNLPWLQRGEMPHDFVASMDECVEAALVTWRQVWGTSDPAYFGAAVVIQVNAGVTPS